jgi:hypothetical protein
MLAYVIVQYWPASGLNEAVGRLWCRDDEELQGVAATRWNVLEVLLEEYVCQDKRNQVGYKSEFAN